MYKKNSAKGNGALVHDLESVQPANQRDRGLLSAGTPPRLAVITRSRLFEGLLVISGLAGSVCNTTGSVWGFIIWLPGNIGLMWLNWQRGSVFQAVLFAAYALTSVFGIISYYGRY